MCLRILRFQDLHYLNEFHLPIIPLRDLYPDRGEIHPLPLPDARPKVLPGDFLTLGSDEFDFFLWVKPDLPAIDFE
jgi:hypothetical protein